VGNLVFAYSNGGTVGRKEEKKANETAKGGEEEEAPKTIRRVDAETGV
jgi:hypothetical protein